jgi:hypothetical protein
MESLKRLALGIMGVLIAGDIPEDGGSHGKSDGTKGTHFP